MATSIRILSGVSGAGKGTVRQQLRQRRTDIYEVVSYTTRPPREGEVNGKDYYFVTVGEFEQMVTDGLFVEHKRVFSNYYGTPKTALDDAEQEGKIVLLEIDIQGVTEVLRQYDDVRVVFLTCTPDEQEERLEERHTPGDVLEERLDGASNEYRIARELEEEFPGKVYFIHNVQGKLQDTVEAVEQQLF